MTGFIQVIEWKTSRIDEVKQLNEEWRERFPQSGPSRVLACADRDDQGSYMTIVEFDSYEAAMKNSADPATSEFAERMMQLCDGPPTFHNLDVMSEDNRA
jgi:hypothetical protein